MRLWKDKKGVEEAAEEGLKLSFMNIVLGLLFLLAFLFWLFLHFKSSVMQLLGFT